MDPRPAPIPPPERESPALPRDVRRCIERLRVAAGDGLHGVIFFGSRLVGTSPDRYSAADLFVLVEDPRRLYQELHDQGLVRRNPRLLSLLNRILPPNVLWLRADETDEAGCKCFVMRTGDFEHSMSAGAHDHFCKGRLTQRVMIAFARDEASSARIAHSLDTARRDSVAWVPCYLPAEFSVADYCRHMLEISFASEIRPENRDRVSTVFEAQKEYLTAAMEKVLEEEGPAAGIVRAGDHFRRLGSSTACRRRFYFRVTRLRATLRWFKYVLTYENWLDYIVRKIHRRTNLELTLSPAERRFPLLLMWPKFFRVLSALRRAPDKDPEPGDRT